MDDQHVVKVFDTIKEQIEREDNLSYQRNASCLLTNSILSAAVFGIVRWNDDVGTVAFPLATFLAVAGGAISYFHLCGIRAAQAQLEYLFEFFFARAPYFRKLGLPRPFGDKAAHGKGKILAYGLPIIWMIVWAGSFVVYGLKSVSKLLF